MKYICVVYGDEKLFDTLTENELEEASAKSAAWVDDLKQGGHHVLSAGLQPSHTAMTLRSRNGQLSMTDGPFVETKEQMGGFTIIEARDLNEAIQLASKSPCMRWGSIEVRPVWEKGEKFAARST